MKVSLNSIRNFNGFYKTMSDDALAIGVDKLVEKIGAQLGAVDEVIDIGTKYDGILVAKVLSCDKHPNADKLSLCTIDAGKAKPVQVVCGAPNVATGQTVAWIPPGATVPETADKEPFVIEAREIRGKMSHGMLASPKELALGDSHEGILVLDDWLKPGADFAEAIGLKGDYVLDIENKMFTHRPDLFGYMGVARELAGIQGMAFKSPDWYIENAKLPAASGPELKLIVKNELPKLVPRFSAITISGTKVGPSPAWLIVELAKVGQKSINNVVDLTNYLMQLTGQPLHAYDYDKVKALSGSQASIVIRQAKKGDKLKLLNGKTIEPSAEAVVIATDKQAIGLGGVMGGSETEVDAKTQNIILEVANFDMYNTRRTSMVHGLFTDAVTRFSKGQSPRQTLAVIARATGAVLDLTGGQVAGPVIDDKHAFKPSSAVKVTAGFINDRLGEKLSAAQMKKLLENVEFSVKVSGESLSVTAPFWRTDIEIPEDVVEEVGRLYGYDHLPLQLPKRDLTPTRRDALLAAKAGIRSRLAKAGANEVLTYSFVPGDLLTKTGQDPKQAFKVANALSPDLQFYRPSLVPSLLDKIHPNIKAGYDEFTLFEIGKVNGLDNGQDDDGLPQEFEVTALVTASADKLKRPGAAYYLAKHYLENLVGSELVYQPVPADMQKYAMVRPYAADRSALVNDKASGAFLGIVGEFRPSVARALKLPQQTAGFEVDSTELAKLLSGQDYQPLPRFPKVTQDITLKVPAAKTYQQVYDLLQAELAKAQPKHSLAAFSPIGIYQPEKDDKHRHITLRLSLANHDRTLTDKEVNALLDEVAAVAKTKLQAERL